MRSVAGNGRTGPGRLAPQAAPRAVVRRLLAPGPEPTEPDAAGGGRLRPSCAVQQRRGAPDRGDTHAVPRAKPPPTANDAASSSQAEDASTGQHNGPPRVHSGARHLPAVPRRRCRGAGDPGASPPAHPIGPPMARTAMSTRRRRLASGRSRRRHHDKNSGETAVVLRADGAAAAALPPASAPVDNAKKASVALPVEPSAVAAAAAQAGVTPSGRSGDGTATALAGPSGHTLVAAITAGLSEGQPAQPAADQVAAPSGDAFVQVRRSRQEGRSRCRGAVGGGGVEPVGKRCGSRTAPADRHGNDRPRLIGSVGDVHSLAPPENRRARSPGSRPPGRRDCRCPGRGDGCDLVRSRQSREQGRRGGRGGRRARPNLHALRCRRGNAEARRANPTSQAPAAASQASQTADPAPVDRRGSCSAFEQAVQSLGDQAGSLRLRLSPPGLGSLRISLSVRHGELNARSGGRDLLRPQPAVGPPGRAPATAWRNRTSRSEQFDVDVADRRPVGWAARRANSASIPNRIRAGRRPFGSGRRSERRCAKSRRFRRTASGRRKPIERCCLSPATRLPWHPRPKTHRKARNQETRP